MREREDEAERQIRGFLADMLKPVDDEATASGDEGRAKYARWMLDDVLVPWTFSARRHKRIRQEGEDANTQETRGRESVSGRLSGSPTGKAAADVQR